jgi:DNA-binding CsgD family transcriptional regulator
VESVLAYFFEGDWPALAAATRQFGAAPIAGQGSVGLASAALGAMNHLRAGDEQTARHLLSALAQIHARIDPADFMYSSTFDRACAVAWELDVREVAAQYQRLAHELIRDSDSLGMLNAYELDLARMAALLGEHDEAAHFFARARATLAAAGHRPMRAIVDYDETLALRRAGIAHAGRITDLLDAALTQFSDLGMTGWVARARTLLDEQADARPAPQALSRTHALTPREVDILRLVASGHTNQEIAAILFISATTVQRHLANVYTKIDAHGRAEATTYALQHGITPRPRPA